MNTTNIYTLSHPITGEIKYVGKSNDLHLRLIGHKNKKENTKKGAWIVLLATLGLAPIIELLDIVPEGDWHFWEMYWISQIKSWGFDLKNGDNGGLGSDRLTQETKKKIALTLTGRTNKKLWKTVAQYDLQGNYIQTFESYQIAAKAVSTSHSNICRAQKNGLSCAGFLWSRTNGQISLKIETRFDGFGKLILSDETIKKLSLSKKGKGLGKKVSLETREKQRMARVGVAPVNKGKKAASHTLEKMQASSVTKKAVEQLTLEGTYIQTFPSLKKAQELTSAHRMGIKRVLNGIANHSGGFKWRYA